LPIILDADDIILHREVVKRYCEIVGLDSTKCRFNWEPASKAEQDAMHSIERRMKSSLLSSNGLIKTGKTAVGLDIEQEVSKWKEEFGEAEGTKIGTWVRDAMPDYNFLKARRLRPRNISNH